jgi:HAD superfamily hydrolase (TIGR01490 family)
MRWPLWILLSPRELDDAGVVRAAREQHPAGRGFRVSCRVAKGPVDHRIGRWIDVRDDAVIEPRSPWPRHDPAPAVAFLDVDGTLLPATTSFLFARELVRRGLVPRGLLVRNALRGLEHRLGVLDYARLAGASVAWLGRIPMPELERIAYEVFASRVRPILFPGVVEHLLDLRRRGTRLVLVSSSPGFVLEPLSIYLGCEAVLSTPLRVEGGRVVGLGGGTPCYGAGKLEHVRRWAEEEGIVMDAAAAYADNWTDRHLLSLVGRAVAVQPGHRLRYLSRRNGWHVVDPARPRSPRD